MKRILLAALILSASLGAISAHSADWSSCADDLDRLRRAARDAADVAEEVKSKADDFENCKQFPDVYDFMRDRCQSNGYDYRNAVSNLANELDSVVSRVRSVNSSCEIDSSTIGSPTSKRPRAPSSANRMCDLYRSYKNKLPIATLLKSCTSSMSEAECRKCIN